MLVKVKKIKFILDWVPKSGVPTETMYAEISTYCKSLSGNISEWLISNINLFWITSMMN